MHQNARGRPRRGRASFPGASDARWPACGRRCVRRGLGDRAGPSDRVRGGPSGSLGLCLLRWGPVVEDRAVRHPLVPERALPASEKTWPGGVSITAKLARPFIRTLARGTARKQHIREAHPRDLPRAALDGRRRHSCAFRGCCSVLTHGQPCPASSLGHISGFRELASKCRDERLRTSPVHLLLPLPDVVPDQEGTSRS